ncbi:MAG: hypothetical protein D3M94_18070 [Rhodocyclales bacterium GT-UBC]|nr:MAG: hypothetical protein D3M94_18070 [Rhodocyclales bacterium GT-UBC]
MSRGRAVTTSDYLSLFLQALPPPPSSVRLALSDASGAQMSRSFYRCLTRELGGLGIDDLVLSQPAAAPPCDWLGEAVAFAKAACRVPHVSLRGDLFALSEEALVRALAAGLDCLMIELNSDESNWPGLTEPERLAYAASLENRLRRVLLRRDENDTHLHKCVVKLVRMGRQPTDEAFDAVVEKLGEMCEVFVIERPEGAVNSLGMPTTNLCWGPFTEAFIDASGHLLACRHDVTGRSFVADLKAIEFMQAWHGQPFQDTRRAQLAGGERACLCAHCPGQLP